MKGQYTIAVCDILGFSDLIRDNPLDQIVGNTLGWFRKALHHSVNRDEWPETIPSLDQIDQNSRVGLAWFSDTILLFTRKDTDKSLQELLNIVAWLLFATTIEGTTRLRAGIAYGEAFIDPENAMYVGKPIVCAYQLEQLQQWSGAALTESAFERVPESFRNGEYSDWPIVPYKVPLKVSKAKENKIFSKLAINWTYGIHDPLSFHWSAENEEPTAEDWTNKKSICQKWQNTKQFHLDVCDRCAGRNEVQHNE